MWPGSDPAVPPAFWLGVTAAVGWLWGSFLNQLADRRPYRAPPPPGRPAGPPPGAGWLHPARSVCFGCGAVIPWYDNVPVLAWLWLRGRCRRCGAPIGLRTLLVEVTTPLAFAAVYGGWRAAGQGRLGIAALLPALAAVSWLVLVTVLLAERRRVHPFLLALGLLLGLGLAASLA